MLSIELDSFDESLRKRAALKKCPVLKRRFWRIVTLVIAIFVLLIAFRDIEGTQRLYQGVVVLILIPFLAWALFHTPLMTIGSSSDAFTMLSGSTQIYTYSFSNRSLIESSSSGDKNYPINEYIGVVNEPGNVMVVFEDRLVYLPSRAVRNGSIDTLLNELKRHVTTQGSRGAVTGAPV